MKNVYILYRAAMDYIHNIYLLSGGRMSRFTIILLAAVAVFIGIFFVSKRESASNQPSSNAQATQHTIGAGTSGVTLVEYGDFQCPACASFYPVVKQVKEKYGDQITFQFRHFPLVQIHRHALLSSKAAEAASNQGKFFEMHDMLYETQASWTGADDPLETFVSYAKQLGLDEAKFRADLTASATNDIVIADVAEANKLGATSTPTFVLDGKRLEQNPGSIEEFYKLIDDAIAAKAQQ